MKYLWIAMGWTSVGLGVVGAFLPLLPTTPFLLLAAFAFSRGSDHLHDWLINHETFGPPIVNWQRHRAISRRVKVYATFSIVLIFSMSLVMNVPGWAMAAQAAVLTLVLVMLWTRNEGPGGAAETRQ